MAAATETTFVEGVFEVEIVIAGHNDDRRNRPELLDPGKKAFALSVGFDFVTAVDKITGDTDVVGSAFFGGIDERLKGLIFDESTVVNIANKEKA